MTTQSMPAYGIQSKDTQGPSSSEAHALSSPTAACQSFIAPLGSYPRVPSSSVGILHVLGYTPAEGEQNVPVVVNFNCSTDLAAGSHIRLVVGRRAVGTKVRELGPTGYGHWQLEATVPLFSRHNSTSPNLPLTIQALADDKTLLDSVTFGEFTYREPGREKNPTTMMRKHTPSLSSNSSALTRTAPTDVSSHSESSDRPRRRSKPYSRPSTPASCSDSEPGQSQAQKTSTRPQPQTQGLRRMRQAIDTAEDGATASLDIMVVLDSFCYNWDDLEMQAGRRLVRFSRIRDGNKLLVSAERILPGDYDAKDIVISCIYRDETDSCCVTSVDIIHLLQKLVAAEFVVEEKNRIRRNLEGLRPTTVSKSRPGFEGLFQRIMDFPDPKPRKIEKDLKVFDWKLLPQALDKIISKYSLSNFGPIPTKESSLSASYQMSVQRTNMQPKLEFCPSVGDSVHLEGSQGSQSHLSQFSQACVRQSPQLESPIEDSLFYPMPEDHLQSVYVGPDVVPRYYPGHEPYFVPSMDPSHYPVDPSMALANTPSPMSPLSAYHHNPTWDLQSRDDVTIPPGVPADHQQRPAFDFISSHEPLDMYSIPQYAMHTYDSFEFQTLREHSMNPSLASQVA
ncbi:hypothetical protein DFJ58DRAFT_863540 [Suillus subalutaceus]|uniref:uncharacterized protein n=1 Tax=Suillus subalutaceus TaxID=48586 RepID=UPI001B879FE5|nr:uncharacterized protein DFJ58DRAFT_863540 [Suillus subalutaceus]KAG1865873.1 hypothetical protein DFJ58DRAFT_863540 [Suillus subalutaceus]